MCIIFLTNKNIKTIPSKKNMKKKNSLKKTEKTSRIERSAHAKP